jgi:decaprenylphospho-beta-D-erythro-pentofuranosid-2-ulose 2-reductase
MTTVRSAADATPAPAAVPAGARRVLLLGGSSDIGLAIVRRLAADGPVTACLLGRDRPRLAAAQRLLGEDGVTSTDLVVADADECESHEHAVASAFETAGGFDVVVLAVGRLGAQAGLDADPRESIEVMRVTFLGAASLMLHCLRRLREQGGGTLIVLSSVAAERPRAANPVYGAAKAGLDALAQALGDAAVGTGVRVLVVRPGFVRTRMTAGLAAAPMAAAPEQVADATVRALAGRAHTVWVPGRLRYVFAVLRHLPRSIFRRLAL